MKATSIARMWRKTWARLLMVLLGGALVVLIAYVAAGVVAACAVGFIGGLIALQVWAASSGKGQVFDEFILKRPPDGG